MVISIEQHVDWITDCVVSMRERGIVEIDPTVEAEDEWRAHSEAIADTMLLPGTKSSWQNGGNVLNIPHQCLAYLGSMHNYRQKCNNVAAKGYEGFTLTHGFV